MVSAIGLGHCFPPPAHSTQSAGSSRSKQAKREWKGRRTAIEGVLEEGWWSIVVTSARKRRRSACRGSGRIMRHRATTRFSAIVRIECWQPVLGLLGSVSREPWGPPKGATISSFCPKEHWSWTAPTWDRTWQVSTSTCTSTCSTPRPAATSGYVSRYFVPGHCLGMMERVRFFYRVNNQRGEIPVRLAVYLVSLASFEGRDEFLWLKRGQNACAYIVRTYLVKRFL